MTAQPALGKADRVLGKDLLTVSAISPAKVARLLRLAAQLKSKRRRGLVYQPRSERRSASCSRNPRPGPAYRLKRA